MNEQYQELDEAILTLTGSPEWKYLVSLLEAENAAALQNELESESWEDVKWNRGYRAALSFVANVRDATKLLIQQAEHDAVV